MLGICGQEFLCRRRHIFVSHAIQRALVYLPMPEFGGSQQLTRKEVSSCIIFCLSTLKCVFFYKNFVG